MTARSWTSSVTSVARPVSVMVERALLHRLHGDGGGGHGQREADDDGNAPTDAQQQKPAGDNERRGQHLGDAQAEDLVAQAPEFERMHLEPDEEQHHDDAELGDRRMASVSEIRPRP